MTITCSSCAQLAIRQHQAFSKHQNFTFIYQSLGTTSVQGRTIVATSQFNRRNASSSSTQRKDAQNQSIRTKPSRSPSSPSSSSSSSLTLRTKSLASSVNPPLSTLPAKLELPEGATTGSAQSFLQKAWRYIKVARAYIGFYKTGLKNTYSNYKDSIPIRRELGLSLFIPTSPVYSARTTPSTGGTSLNTAIQSLKITRADFQLVRRAASDLRRLMPFAILLLICGELTPLVVLAIGDAITPYCCRVPKQLEKTRRKRLEQKRAAFAAVQAGLGSMRTIAVGSSEEITWLAEQFGSREFASTASVEQVLRACAVFGLTNSINRGVLGSKFVYRPRLQRWTEYLALDDRLILQAGGPNALSVEELQIAVEERGGVGVGADSRPPESQEKIMRQWLKEWFKRRKVELNN